MRTFWRAFQDNPFSLWKYGKNGCFWNKFAHLTKFVANWIKCQQRKNQNKTKLLENREFGPVGQGLDLRTTIVRVYSAFTRLCQWWRRQPKKRGTRTARRLSCFLDSERCWSSRGFFVKLPSIAIPFINISNEMISFKTRTLTQWPTTKLKFKIDPKFQES